MKSLSFSSSTLGFGRVKVNTVNSKVAVLRNAGTELVSITKVDSSSPVFVCTFTGIIFAKFPPRTLLYYDAEGKIHALSGEYYTNSTGKFLLGYVNAFGQLLVILSSLEIISLNSGNPLIISGAYTEHEHYFLSTNGAIVNSSSLLKSNIFVGIGNANKNIDLDLKVLTIDLDTFSVSVLLDTNFMVSGTATLISDKIYIEAYNGSAWVDLNNGNPIDIVLGEFELTTAQLKASDGFEGGNVYVVRARDFDGYVTSSQENINTDNIMIITDYSSSVFSGGNLSISGTFIGTGNISVLLSQGTVTKETSVPIIANSWSTSILVSILDGFNVNQYISIKATKDGYSHQIIDATYLKPTVTITTPLNNARVVEMGVPITVSGTSDGETVDIVSYDRNAQLILLASDVPVVGGSYSTTVTYTTEHFDQEENYVLGVRDSIFISNIVQINIKPPSQFAVVTPTNYTIFDTDTLYTFECVSESNVHCYCDTLQGDRIYLGVLYTDGTSAIGNIVLDNAFFGTGHTEINGTSRGESKLRNFTFISDDVEIVVPCIVSSGKTHGLGRTSAYGEVRGSDGDTIGTTSSTGEVRGSDGDIVGTTSAEGEKI